MDKFVELIDLIKSRPELYISCRSINYLKVYVDGFLFGLSNEKSSKFMVEVDEFRAWLSGRFNVCTNQNWAQIILFYSPNEVVALDTFFLLYDEFGKVKGAEESA